MSNFFLKMMKSLKGEAVPTKNTEIKLSNESSNGKIEHQQAMQIKHSEEVERQERIDKHAEEIKKEAKERELEKKIYSDYLMKIEKFYTEHEKLIPVVEIIQESKLKEEEVLLFYVFHEIGVEKLEDAAFMKSLLNFLSDKIHYQTTAKRIELLVKEKFLFIKNVYIFDAWRSKQSINISCIDNVVIKRLPGKELEFKLIKYYDLFNINIENDDEIYMVKFSYSDYEDSLKMNEHQKNLFENYFNRMNKQRKLKLEAELDLIESVSERLDSDSKMMVYNFINEIPKDFLLHPHLYQCLEYYIAKEYYLGNCIVETKADDRERYVRWRFQEQPNILAATKNIKENYFDKLIEILKTKLDIEEKFIAPLVWLEFNKQVKTNFSNKWLENYGAYFKDCDLNTENLVYSYCHINEIDSLESENISYLTYYLMNLGVFENNTQFLLNYWRLYSEIEEIKKSMELEAFERKLMKTTSTENKIIDFNDLDVMTGIEFEHVIAELFKKMGYFAIVTKGSGDQGIDVIAEKDGRKFGIQTKCYGSKVTNTAVQETVAGIVYHKCDRGIVITNNYFTSSAIELANKNDIILWNRDILKEKFNEFINN